MKRLAAGLTDAGDDRAAMIDELVACPWPLVPILADDNLLAACESPGPLLEVLTRRYYKIRDLEPPRFEQIGEFDVCLTQYARHHRTIHVVAIRAGAEAMADALAAVAAAVQPIQAPDTVVVDVYLPFAADSAETADSLSAKLIALLGSVSLPGAVRRIALIASHAGSSQTDLLTFRRAGDEGVRPYWMSSDPEEELDATDASIFEEDVKFRGLHPMIARRLQMWRLSNFEISRLPSPGEVHLFDCLARGNPGDERLVAVAEVRDLTPIRDDAGRVVALPEVEHVLVECLDALRDALADRPQRRELAWNRIALHVWPPVELPFDELNAVARRLAPLTDGLGLEQVIVSGRIAVPGSDELVEASCASATNRVAG